MWAGEHESEQVSTDKGQCAQVSGQVNVDVGR